MFCIFFYIYIYIYPVLYEHGLVWCVNIKDVNNFMDFFLFNMSTGNLAHIKHVVTFYNYFEDFVI